MESPPTAQPTVSEDRTVAGEYPRARYGVLLVVLATIIWSTAGPLLDQLLSNEHLTPVEVSFWRAAIATAAVGLFILVRRPSDFLLPAREIPFFALYGLVSIALMQIVWSHSVQVNKAAVATVLVYCAAVFVALGEWRFFGRRATPVQAGAIAVNLVGCALVARVYDFGVFVKNPVGAELGLATGLLFSAYALLGKGAPQIRRHSGATILFYFLFFGTLGLAVMGGVTEGDRLLTLHLSMSGWLVLVILALGPTTFGFSLFTASLRYLPATVATLINTTEPTLSAIWAYLFLGRAMNPVQWLGTLLIVGAVMAMQADVIKLRRHGVEAVPIGDRPVEEMEQAVTPK